MTGRAAFIPFNETFGVFGQLDQDIMLSVSAIFANKIDLSIFLKLWIVHYQGTEISTATLGAYRGALGIPRNLIVL